MNINEKIDRVISSCKTNDQLVSAARYVCNALSSRKITMLDAYRWSGVMDGISFERGYK